MSLQNSQLPSMIRYHSPGNASIVPETESEVSCLGEYPSGPHPTLASDSHHSSVGWAQPIIPLSPGMGPTLDVVSRRLEDLVEDLESTNEMVSQEITTMTNIAQDHFPQSSDDVLQNVNVQPNRNTPSLEVVAELMKEMRNCIRELRCMYESMQSSYEDRRKEEAIRLTVYNDILQLLVNRD